MNPFKTKEDLDILTHQEIDKYRNSILSNPNFTPEYRQYIKELEYYTNIRFKDSVFDMFKRWEVESERENTDALTKSGLELIASITKKPNGKQAMYDLTIKTLLDEIKEFKFIKNIPNEY